MSNLGVVIGRFQTPALSDGHLWVLRSARVNNDSLLVLVGVTEARGTKANPLEYNSRISMLHQALDGTLNATFVPIKDHPSNERWAEKVDDLIEMFKTHDDLVKLYGGRDSCLPIYKAAGGKYPVNYLESMSSPSATVLRARVKPIHSLDFRSGVIYGSQRNFPAVYPVVDVVVQDGNKVLLARKATDTPNKWRLIGGFVDPTDKSLEMAARREVMEEAGIEIGNLRYVQSAIIDDWRYRRGPEKVMSSVFLADYLFGMVRPKDDIEAAIWYPATDVHLVLLPEHQEIWQAAYKLMKVHP